MKTAIRLFLFLSLLIPNFVFGQTASLLPNGVQQFFDNNGNPLSAGTVDFYIVGTTTRKTTWKNSGETLVNTNPVVLDAGGKAVIYGQGSYRQILKDRAGNLIWDAITTPGGSGGSSPTATGDGDLVGTVKPWAGITAPSQYVFAAGQEISRTGFASLLTAVTLVSNANCTNSNNTLTGLVDTTSIRIGSPIEVVCAAPGTTVVSKTSSTVVMSGPATITITAAATFFPFGNGNGTTTFNVPDLRGVVIAGRTNMGGTTSSNLTSTYFGTGPDAQGAAGGTQSHILLLAELAAHNHASPALTDPGHTHNYNTAVNKGLNRGAGSPTDAWGGGDSSVLTTSSTTGITLAATTGSTGSGTAFSLVQPTMTLNYIIKVTPDSNSATASGVTSLGGMTGDITCGSGVLCTGNTISVTFPAGVVQGPSTSVIGHPAIWNNTSGSLLSDPTSITYLTCLGINDTAALNAAFLASNTRILVINRGTCTTDPLTISQTNTNAPRQIMAYGAVFQARAASASPTLTIENVQGLLTNFEVSGLNVDANGLHAYPLKIHGSQFASYRDIELQGGTTGGLWLSGEPGFGIYYTSFLNVYSHNNAVGAGVIAKSINNVGQYYIAANVFVGIRSIANGNYGFDFDYASLGIYDSDAETNATCGFNIDHAIQVDITSVHIEANNATPCAFTGTANTTNLKVYGGRTVGSITSSLLTSSSNTFNTSDAAAAPVIEMAGTQFLTGVVNVPTGFRINSAATSLHVLKGNGTNYIDGQVAFSELTGSAACSQLPALTGDVTTSAGTCATSLANIPTATTMAGNIIATNIVAPGTPASGKTGIYVDSTSKRLCSKNDAGTIGCDVVASTGSAGQFVNGIVNGVLQYATPSGSGTVNSGIGNQIAYYATTGSAISGNANFNISSGDLTIGQAGSVIGTLSFVNVTSGTIKLTPPTGALGTIILTLPDLTDTIITKTSTDTLTNKTLDTAGTGNSFKINGTSITAVTGTGSVVLATSPTLITPTLGVASATTVNKITITIPATGSTLTIADGKTVTHNSTTTFTGVDSKTLTINNSGTLAGGDSFTLAIASSKTFTVNNSLTLAGTDGTTITFQGTDTYVGRTTTDTLTNKTLTAPAITSPVITSSFTATGLVTNASLANMSAGTIKCNNTGGSSAPIDCTTAQVQTLLNLPYIYITATGINFNSAVTDTAMAFTMPTGFTRFKLVNSGGISISHCSAALGTATIGFYTAPSAGGVSMISPATATTISSTSENTNGNSQGIAATNQTATSYLPSGFSTPNTVYWRIITPQGLAATCDVEIVLQLAP